MTPHQRIAYESILTRAKVTKENFIALLEQSEFVPVEVLGEPGGGLIIKGNEIHACIGAGFECRWVNKKLLRVLNSVIEKNGFAVTRATTERGKVFIKRLGFQEQKDGTFKREKLWALRY